MSANLLGGLKGLNVSKHAKSGASVKSGVNVNVGKQDASKGLKTWQWLLIVAGVGAGVMYMSKKGGK